jgi:hypothetical protein
LKEWTPAEVFRTTPYQGFARKNAIFLFSDDSESFCRGEYGDGDQDYSIYCGKNLKMKELHVDYT